MNLGVHNCITPACKGPSLPDKTTDFLVYMVQCNRCHRQYLGETKRRLQDRLNEHRRHVDKQTNSSKPTAVPEQFLSNNRNAKEMQLT